MIRAAVLTISDSSFEGTREDRSGPALCERVTAAGWTVTHTQILPDERLRISARLAELADSGLCDLILTTGGTGVAPRDITPEATLDIAERQIPGIGELMRSEGRAFTPLAVLSRGLAASRGTTLIVNVPGSPKGAVQSFDAIVKLVPHLVDLLHGRTGH